MGQVLYHYTDFVALDGILHHKELRLNNVLNMNDAEEMQLFMRGIFVSVRRRLEAEGGVQKALQLQALFDDLKQKRFEYSAYAACFSLYRDDAAQWERYANRGRGVCLGMRREVLERMAGGAMAIQEVFYQDHMESHPLVERIHDLVLASDEISERNQSLRAQVREAWRDSASFKHPSFSSEKEIRLVVMPFHAEDFDMRPRYHVAKERIKKYYPLDLEAMCERAHVTIEDLVSCVIIGPQSSQSLPILQDYLRDLSLRRLADNVFLSDCPLQSRI
jgi:hypothetical protein